jgi:hypothetical protein
MHSNSTTCKGAPRIPQDGCTDETADSTVASFWLLNPNPGSRSAKLGSLLHAKQGSTKILQANSLVCKHVYSSSKGVQELPGPAGCSQGFVPAPSYRLLLQNACKNRLLKVRIHSATETTYILG